MKLDLGFLGSRFAIRLYGVFILAAVIPVLGLAFLSFSQLTDQRLELSADQQDAEVRSLGLGIYDRLTLLQAELELIDFRSELGLDLSVASLPKQQQDDLADKFTSIGWIGRQDVYSPFLGAEHGPYATIAKRELNSEIANFVLTTLESSGDSPHIFLLQVDENVRGQRLVAELNTEYLWSPEIIDTGFGLCLLTAEGNLLYCSTPTEAAMLVEVASRNAESFQGNFEWRNRQNELFLVNYWSIYLQNIFGVGDWTIFTYVPRQEVLQPVTDFQITLILVFLITLSLVLLLSSGLIRRILTPLGKLTTGIQEFGNNNFHNKVIIDSDDEFQDLADSFNDMGVKIADQFQSLETLAEIDRLILSSQDADNIVQIVLVRIHDIIGCDQIGIASQNKEGQFLKMYIRGDAQNAQSEILEAKIDLSQQDVQFLKDNADGVMVPLDFTAPLFLESLQDLGGAVCLVLPLFIEDGLSAIVALGYAEQPDNVDKLLEDSRSWADRVGVALSNAKWQEKLYRQANFDALTGLPNRPAFRTYLQQALNRAERNREMVGVLFIDLDRFKLVNDTLGHAAGDDYLVEIAERLSHCLRNTDMLARLGGDEFTIVVTESPDFQTIKTSISAVAEKLLDAVPKPISMEGQELRSTASIGISIYPLDADNIEDLMKNADSAMYHAKANGGGSYHYFSEKLNQAMTEQLRVEHELRFAIQNDQLQLHYQSQVDAKTEQLVGAEALLRWIHPKAGLISPDDFIPIAEETNLIVEIDNWVLEAACKQLQRWRQEDRPKVRIAVNLSARYFQQDNVVAELTERVERYGIDPRLLELEITEGSLINDIDAALATLEELRKLNFILTIDDFGTGYSSLSYLKRLPIDKLKIDQAFVRKCVIDEVDNALVKTIITMAHNLKIECIAEGVELEEQLEFLRKEKCNEIQGFYFAPPLPIEGFEARYFSDA